MKHPYILQILAVIFLFFGGVSAHSQQSDIGNWLIYFGNQPIDKTWNWHNELQIRNYNFLGDIQQVLVRTGIGYNLTENNNNILLGYGYIHSERYLPNSDEKTSSTEHRIFQQFITKQNPGGVFILHRYRVEERFLPDDFQVRFRYFLAFNIPLNTSAMTPNTIYLSAYNEIFLNAQSPVFDRNRLYGAIGYVLGASTRCELGYMSQMLEKSSRGQFQVVFYNNLPL